MGARRLFKGFLLVLILSTVVSPALAQDNSSSEPISVKVQGTGVQQKVSVDVQRTDYGFFQMLDVYCRYYNLEFCANKVSIWNPMVTWKAYQYYRNEKGQELYKMEQKYGPVHTVG